MPIETAHESLPQSQELNYYTNAKGMVTVVTQDNHRFRVTVEAAIRACEALNHISDFQTQFSDLLDRLAAWVNEHESAIRLASVTVRDRGLLFLVVRKATSHDPHFDDDLTALDIEIAQNEAFDLIRLSVLSLPNSSVDALGSFVDPDNTLTYRKKDVESRSAPGAIES